MKIQLDGLATGEDHELNGQYVVSYDPEYHWPDGHYDGGALVTTPDYEKATNFTPEAAIQLWLVGPTCRCHRLRPDGKPNRPLSAFNFHMVP